MEPGELASRLASFRYDPGRGGKLCRRRPLLWLPSDWHRSHATRRAGPTGHSLTRNNFSQPRDEIIVTQGRSMLCGREGISKSAHENPKQKFVRTVPISTPTNLSLPCHGKLPTVVRALRALANSFELHSVLYELLVRHAHTLS